MSGPSASRGSSRSRMRDRLAPVARAASITPGRTVSRFCSTMRLIANSEAIVMAKIPNTGPIPGMPTARASGCTAASRITKGIGRKKFTTTLSVPNRNRFGNRLPGRVAYSARPTKSPAMPPNTRLSDTTYSVSAVACHRSGSRSMSLSTGVLLDERCERRDRVDRLLDSIRLSSQRQREVAEHAAPDVVDAAVHELEPHAVRRERREYVGLRRRPGAAGRVGSDLPAGPDLPAVPDLQRDDATGMPVAQRAQLRAGRDVLDDARDE